MHYNFFNLQNKDCTCEFSADFTSQKVYLFRLFNENINIVVSNFGGSLNSVFVKDKNGQYHDVVLCYDNPDDCNNDDRHFLGLQLGRCANLISKGHFFFKNSVYDLDKNYKGNFYNGGFFPFGHRFFAVEKFTLDEVTFSLLSPDGDQGFPGNLDIEITYHLLENGFEIIYSAISDTDTICNLSTRNFFNLNGEGKSNILNHKLKINADYYLPINETLLPKEYIASVKNTPMDFTNFKRIGKDIYSDFETIKNGNGFTCYYPTDSRYSSSDLNEIIELQGDISGITMKIYTDYPGVFVYTASYVNNLAGKNNHVYNKYDGVAFIPQFFPNAINVPYFEQPVIEKNKRYIKKVRYLFS